jgi:3-deoxy-D-manno-octulosonic-acid transferase
MMNRWLILGYSSAMRYVAWPLAKLGSVLSDSLERQTHGRGITSESILEMARQRRRFARCVIFFCSSAGEYEQAKPLIDRFQEQQVYTHIFFFSQSGMEFAAARDEKSPYSLAPIDAVWSWGSIFAALRPDAVMIVRHEFWPAFLWTAAQWCKIYIIDAVPPAMLGREFWLKTYASAFSKRMMLGPEAVAYTVDASGTKYFKTNLKFPAQQIHECGDTKYDRVIERVTSMRATSAIKATELRALWNDPSTPILIIGSAHVADMEVVLPALKLMNMKVRLLVVPHDLSSRNLSRISDLIMQAGRTSELMSEVDTQMLDHRKTEQNSIVVDSMGRLSELYAIGDLAWVGGAMHAKIHNVLEPAAWGLPISAGPRYKNSQEAKYLVERGAIQIADDPKSAAAIWQKQIDQGDEYKARVSSEIHKMSGASDRIVGDFLADASEGDAHA